MQARLIMLAKVAVSVLALLVVAITVFGQLWLLPALAVGLMIFLLVALVGLWTA